ncbi:hypothetical protein CPC08DRAFT_771687 [Agrocybe pediades]|nr:hypothetical protein CPC08DRAFT_771687 [Agrocybe pediades]
MCLLRLAGKESLDDYPDLKDEDMHFKNAASARKIGDAKSTDSWIWTFGALRGLNNAQKADFVLETEKVQLVIQVYDAGSRSLSQSSLQIIGDFGIV